MSQHPESEGASQDEPTNLSPETANPTDGSLGLGELSDVEFYEARTREYMLAMFAQYDQATQDQQNPPKGELMGWGTKAISQLHRNAQNFIDEISHMRAKTDDLADPQLVNATDFAIRYSFLQHNFIGSSISDRYEVLSEGSIELFKNELNTVLAQQGYKEIEQPTDSVQRLQAQLNAAIDAKLGSEADVFVRLQKKFDFHQAALITIPGKYMEDARGKSADDSQTSGE